MQDTLRVGNSPEENRHVEKCQLNLCVLLLILIHHQNSFSGGGRNFGHY